MKGLRVQGTKGRCGDQGEKGPWADEGPNRKLGKKRPQQTRGHFTHTKIYGLTQAKFQPDKCPAKQRELSEKKLSENWADTSGKNEREWNETFVPPRHWSAFMSGNLARFRPDSR